MILTITSLITSFGRSSYFKLTANSEITREMDFSIFVSLVFILDEFVKEKERLLVLPVGFKNFWEVEPGEELF